MSAGNRHEGDDKGWSDKSKDKGQHEQFVEIADLPDLVTGEGETPFIEASLRPDLTVSGQTAAPLLDQSSSRSGFTLAG